MVSCAKCRLTKNKHSKESGVTFHRFPKKDDVCRALWTGFVAREGWQPNNYSLLCSQHFEPDWFDYSAIAIVKLKENAIPTIDVYRQPVEPKSNAATVKTKAQKTRENELLYDGVLKSDFLEDEENEKESNEDDSEESENETWDDKIEEDDGVTNGDRNDWKENQRENHRNENDHNDQIIDGAFHAIIKEEPFEDPRLKKYTVADILAHCRSEIQCKGGQRTDSEEELDVNISTEPEKTINITNIKQEVSEDVIQNRENLCHTCCRSNKPYYKSNDNGFYICQQCHSSHSTIPALRKHLESHDISRHKCLQCTLSFTCAVCLTKHIAQSHESHRYHCNNCNKHYPSKQQLRRHMTQHKGTKYFCCYCQKSFPYKVSLRYHLNNHQGNKFYCAHCPSFTFDKGSLSRHLERHMGLSYACSRCPKVYLSKDALRIHTNNKHLVQNKRLHACDQCEKTFSFRGNLSAHLKIHQGLRFYCKYCPREFLYRQNWKEHELSHEGASYICTICNKNFSRRGNLLRHVRQEHEHLRIPISTEEIERMKLKFGIITEDAKDSNRS